VPRPKTLRTQDDFRARKELALRLRIGRAFLGWSLAELAAEFGMDSSTLSRTENAQMFPSADLRARIDRCLAENGVEVAINDGRIEAVMRDAAVLLDGLKLPRSKDRG